MEYLTYSSFSDEEWEKSVSKMNDFYEEAFGERPFNRYMMIADYNYLSMQLVIHTMNKLKGN